MPYRIDLHTVGGDTIDRLVELGALDIEPSEDGGLAALMPDSVTPEHIARTLGTGISASPAVARDAGSVWVLRPRPIHLGQHTIRLVDSAAFGTGLHPTTALCLEALQDIVTGDAPERMLDVGTGSGVLAVAALTLGVRHAVGTDSDAEAIRVAGENARINAVSDRLDLVPGGPESLTGTWPLVLANVLAAPLIEMAPTLVRRVGGQGQLVLSGIPASVAPDVVQAYCRFGMRHRRTLSRDGWIALVLRATW